MDPVSAAAAVAVAGQAALPAAQYLSKLLIENWLGRSTSAASSKKSADREVEAITSAIGIEVAALTEAVARRYAFWSALRKDGQVPSWLPPLVEFNTPAFDAVKDRIEKLPAPVVAAVIRFHGFLRFLNDLQKTRAEYQQALKMADFFQVYSGALVELMTIGVETMERAFLPATKDPELTRLLSELAKARAERAPPK